MYSGPYVSNMNLGNATWPVLLLMATLSESATTQHVSKRGQCAVKGYDVCEWYTLSPWCSTELIKQPFPPARTGSCNGQTQLFKSVFCLKPTALPCQHDCLIIA